MSTSERANTGRTTIGRAIVDVLAYSDVFDYPLTSGQIRRYLVHTPASAAEVVAALASDPWLLGRVERSGDLFCLAGRSATFSLRRERAIHAAWLWPPARRLARIIACLPFARMVAVIGSLTMDNVRSPTDDIDLFIITAAGRVWLTRAMVVALVRLALLRRIDLCPNYIVSEHKLGMASQDLFTARELAQMTPLCGRRAFAALLEANCWLTAVLPNAEPRTEALADLGLLARLAQRALEWPLRGRLGDALERRIQAGKLRQLQTQAATVGSREVVLESEVCKGHMDSHGAKIREEYDRRREHYLALGFEAPAPQAPAPETAWTE